MSKNLGSVIQRAISDGAFRRQLQSDPAAALRGFNLTAAEVAAIRSGDSGTLMSLGVDQRMSKAFTVGGGFLGATRSAGSDVGSGVTANALVDDQTAGARDGIVGDPTSGARDAFTSDVSGARAVHDIPPFEGNVTGLIDPTLGGTRSVHDIPPVDLRSAASVDDLSGARTVHDVPPLEGNANAVAGSDIGDPYSGTYVGVSPEFQAHLTANQGVDAGGPGGNMIAADDDYAVSARMADASAIRSVHDVAPFEGNATTVEPATDFAGGDIQPDPGIYGTHDALGTTTGPDVADEHSWG